MNQYYICAGCGAENELDIELAAGEHQELNSTCSDCGVRNLISARYNYSVNEFELEISAADEDG